MNEYAGSLLLSSSSTSSTHLLLSSDSTYNCKEYFIPVTINDIENEILMDLGNTSEGVGEDSKLFQDMWRMIASLVNFKYQEVTKRLKKGHGMPDDNSSFKTEEEDLNIHYKFIEDVCQTLLNAKFNVVSQEEWNYAIEDDFLFTLPFEVCWDKIHHDLFPRLTHDHRAFSHAPDFSDRVLMFRRGIGVQSIKHYFWNEKIDLLIDYLKNILLKGNHSNDNVKRISFRDYKSGNVISRKSLRDTLPGTRAVLMNFFQKIFLQEPTFKEVVVIYCPKRVAHADNEGGGQHDDKARKIVMKGFCNVPMADLEVTFPNSEINLYIKLRDKIQIISMLIFGMFMILLKIISGSGSWTTSLTLLFCIGLRIFQVWNGMRNARQRNIDEMTRILYSRSLASQQALLYYIIHAAEDQALKEFVLGHYFLWKFRSQGLTKGALKEKCQTFLIRALRVHVDFDVNSCIKKLLEYGLVEKTKIGSGSFGNGGGGGGSSTVYIAKSLEDSVHKLDYIWDNLFQYNKS